MRIGGQCVPGRMTNVLRRVDNDTRIVRGHLSVVSWVVPETPGKGVRWCQAQPSWRSEWASFQTLVMCRIRSPSNSIAYT